MKAVLLFLALCISAIYGSDAPFLSETFTAAMAVTVKDHRGEHQGKGTWAVNQAQNMGLEEFLFEDGHEEFNVFELQRYDLGLTYDVVSTNKTECREFKVSGYMPKVWDWLSLAHYAGKHNDIDIWKADVGYATLTLGVKDSDQKTPVYLIRNSRDEKEITYVFVHYNTTAPPASVFTVPTTCSNSTDVRKPVLGCVARSTAISRAKAWVAAHVPYNQGGDYQGYREDCSGYVSMCWESAKPGHTTSTMHEIAHPISKDDLQPGDCLLFAAEHVVLFGGWTNSAKTEYQAYEETRPGEGTVTRPTPYPYWYSQSSFKPYRYNSIC